jgi:hypothetical protein
LNILLPESSIGADMKIRKKISKAASSKPPLFLIGYSFTAPAPEELRIWFDMEYGGPLALQPEGATGAWSAKHGPWSARIALSLGSDEREMLSGHTVWEHQSTATVSTTRSGPSTLIDSILHATRLARGLTLLTQGTTLDPATQVYSNPSDWNDRPLAHFQVKDHIQVHQEDSPDLHHDWFHTLGMSKFSLDELELMRPRGLPPAEAIEILSDAAGVVVKSGHNTKVGAGIEIPALVRTVTIVKHRTAAPAGRMLAFRELSL